MAEEFYLSIVVPAFKEEKRIHIILEAIVNYEKSKDFAIETIVVADASPDKTVEAAQSFINNIKHLKVIDNKVNKGKGGAVQEGMLAANGQYILFADADNSTPIEQADKLLAFADKYEVVIGSRYGGGGKLATPQSLVRRVGSRALNIIIQTLAIRGIKDTQCGFKLFQKNAAKEIFKRQTIQDFSFDIEILAVARKLGYKIKEAGIVWYDNPHSTVNPIKDGLRMVKDSWQVRKNITKGLYK
jgi:dolichyl-phosphate beta-glucosyltransferase